MKNYSVCCAYILCLCGFLASCYCFYPGYFFSDTLVQLEEAYYSTFMNWEPPIMSGLWYVLIKVFPFLPLGAPMLILQLLMLWLALSILVYLGAKRGQHYLWLFPLLGVFPAVLIYNAIILKDIQMGNSLFLAFALTFLWQQGIVSKYLRGLCIILLLLLTFYAFALRYEAFFACMPLFYLWVEILLPKIRWFYKLLLTLYTLGVFMLASMSFQIAISAYNVYPAQQLMFYDLASLSLQENTLLLPEDTCNYQSDCLAVLRQMYQRELVDPIIVALYQHRYQPTLMGAVDRDPPVLSLKLDLSSHSYAPAYEQLRRAWIAAILQHPFAYLHNRLLFFQGLLWYYPLFYDAWPQDPHHLNLPKPSMKVTQLMILYAKLAPAFNLLFWLVLNFACYGWLYWQRKHFQLRAGVLLFCGLQLGSGLALTLSHFIVAAAPDFRYYYWTMLADLVSFMTMLLSFSETKKGRIHA